MSKLRAKGVAGHHFLPILSSSPAGCACGLRGNRMMTPKVSLSLLLHIFRHIFSLQRGLGKCVIEK